MTSTFALVFALSLILNDMTLLLEESLLKQKFLAANLMYLIGSTILLGQCKLLPNIFWKKCRYLCLMLEVPLATIILETSVQYLWKAIQNYIHNNAERLLVYLADDRGLEGVVCYVCCGKPNCSAIIADLVLKTISFSLLFTVCCAIGFK